MFALELHRAECEFLTGELAAAEMRLTMLSSRATSPVDQATVACLRIDLYTLSPRSTARSMSVSTYLRPLGIDWSPHPTEEEVRREYERIRSLLGAREIEELIDSALDERPKLLAIMDVLTQSSVGRIFLPTHTSRRSSSAGSSVSAWSTAIRMRPALAMSALAIDCRTALWRLQGRLSVRPARLRPGGTARLQTVSRRRLPVLRRSHHPVEADLCGRPPSCSVDAFEAANVGW